MNEPKQGQIEVNINGKLGKSPSEVLFTYQVSAFFSETCFIPCPWLKLEVHLLSTELLVFALQTLFLQ